MLQYMIRHALPDFWRARFLIIFALAVFVAKTMESLQANFNVTFRHTFGCMSCLCYRQSQRSFSRWCCFDNYAVFDTRKFGEWYPHFSWTRAKIYSHGMFAQRKGVGFVCRFFCVLDTSRWITNGVQLQLSLGGIRIRTQTDITL